MVSQKYRLAIWIEWWVFEYFDGLAAMGSAVARVPTKVRVGQDHNDLPKPALRVSLDEHHLLAGATR